MKEDTREIIELIKKDRDYFQKARLLQYLRKEKDIPLKDLSADLGIKPSYICHILRLNRIPEIIIDGYYAKLISLSHLFVLSRVKNAQRMMQLYEKVLAEDLTVLQTEDLVREELYQISDNGDKISRSEIQELKQSLANHDNDLTIQLVQTRVRAKLLIEVKGGVRKTTGALRALISSISKIESR